MDAGYSRRTRSISSWYARVISFLLTTEITFLGSSLLTTGSSLTSRLSHETQCRIKGVVHR